jgi:hypothetical protein
MLLALTLSAAEPARSDGQIEAQLRTKLAKSLIGRDGFTFRVKDGVVYWEGSTTIPQHKGSATRMAKSAGARRVVNQIRVAGAKSPARRASKPADEPAVQPAAEKTKPTAVPKPLPAPAASVSNPAASASPQRATVHWVPAR